jgi:pyruvate/2-oxoglutarate dehydrogenase complex dihydrolipoamide acyltransferase (E2) component
MKACAFMSLGVGTIAIVSFGFVACGGSNAEAPPAAAAPADPAPAPVANAAPEPAASSGPPPAAAAMPAADESAAPAGQEDERSMEVIAAVVKANRQKARDCYEKALKQNSGLKGDLVIHFTLKPNGKVKEATLNRERSTITEPSVVNCVIDVIRSLEYPKSSKGFESTINYPFNFNP